MKGDDGFDGLEKLKNKESSIDISKMEAMHKNSHLMLIVMLGSDLEMN